MKLLLDTNILLDFCSVERSPFHEQSVALLMECFSRSDVTVMIAVSSLNDVYYVLRRRHGEEGVAREDIGKLMNLFDVWPLLERHAREAYASDEPDFEDGLVRAVAEDAGVDVIVTRDAAAFRRSMVPSMDAAQCLAQLSAR